MRVSCPDVESTAAFKTIVREAKVPLVADIHFHYKRALEAADAGAAETTPAVARATVAATPRRRERDRRIAGPIGIEGSDHGIKSGE